MELSVIIPVHNEEKLLSKNLARISRHLKKLGLRYEILVCDNGSTDHTADIARKAKVRYLRVDERGIGLGIRKGIEEARYENLFFYAIDLPFGLKVFDDSLSMMGSHDIVIGSKGHKNSVNRHSFSRKIFSFAYNSLIRIAFGLNVKDSQGSLMFKKSHVKKYWRRLTSKDAFLETQILIYGKKHGSRIIEIPVIYSTRRPGSKIRPVRDGLSMLRCIFAERRRYEKDN